MLRLAESTTFFPRPNCSILHINVASRAAIEDYGNTIPLEALQSLDSMEGVYAEPVAEIAPAQPRPVSPKPSVLPGYLLVGAATLLAYLIHYLPLPPFRVVSETGARYPVSAAILAILVGMAVRN